MVQKRYGYARVSTKEQNLDRQLAALAAAGVHSRDIITDKQSGKDFSRPGWLTLRQQLLRPGDTLVIKELDRLGRDYGQIKAEWAALVAEGPIWRSSSSPILSLSCWLTWRKRSGASSRPDRRRDTPRPGRGAHISDGPPRSSPPTGKRSCGPGRPGRSRARKPSTGRAWGKPSSTRPCADCRPT